MMSSPPLPPPPPPPMPGTIGAPSVATYKEQRQMMTQDPSSQEQQFANLPSKLMNTLGKDKKPFTYTPMTSIGDKGKLDLSQIKSPRMKKRLLANITDSGNPDAPSDIEVTKGANNYLDVNTPPYNYTPSPESQILPTILPVMKQYGGDGHKVGPPRPNKLYTPPQGRSFERVGGKPMSPVEFENSVNQQLDGLKYALQQQQQQDQKYRPVVNNGAAYRPSLPQPYVPPDQTYDPNSHTPQRKHYSVPLPKRVDLAHQVQQDSTPQHQINLMPNLPPSLQEQWEQERNIQPRQALPQRWKELDEYENSTDKPSPFIQAPTLQEEWERRKQREGNPPQQKENYAPQRPLSPPNQPKYFQDPVSEINPVIGVPTMQEQERRKQQQNQQMNLPYKPKISYMQQIPQEPLSQSNVFNPILNAPTMQEQWEKRKMQQVPVERHQYEAEPPPAQSKTFKVLDKLTENIQDEIQKLNMEPDPMQEGGNWKPVWRTQRSHTGEYADPNVVDPRYVGPNIPSQSFKQLKGMVGISDHEALAQVRNPNRREVDIPIIMEGSGRPASEQGRQASPPRYSGGSIPSRSFRILQQMTGEGPHGTDF